MLQFLQCKLTLRKERGDNANFFAFADTLTTKVGARWLDLRLMLAVCPASAARVTIRL